MDDTISYTCSATNVQPGYEVYGELLIGAKYLYFIATQICNEKVNHQLFPFLWSFPVGIKLTL